MLLFPTRHTSDVDPENDSSWFDMEEVELISKESLTCQELEDYLDESIKAGFPVEEDISISSSAHGMKIDKNNKKRKGTSEIIPEAFVKKQFFFKWRQVPADEHCINLCHTFK